MTGFEVPQNTPESEEKQGMPEGTVPWAPQLMSQINAISSNSLVGLFYRFNAYSEAKHRKKILIHFLVFIHKLALDSVCIP